MNHSLAATSALVLAFLTVLTSIAYGGEKLTPAQRDALRRAESYADEVTKGVAAIAPAMEKLAATDNVARFKLAHVQGTRQRVKGTAQPLANAEKALADLPPDDARAVELRRTLAEARARLDEWGPKLDAYITTISSAVEVSRFPDFQRDLDQLKALTAMFRSQRVLSECPDRAVEAVEALPRATEFGQAIRAKYRPLMFQGTEEGSKLDTQFKAFDAAAKAFDQALKEFVQIAPDTIRTRLGNAIALAEPEALKRAQYPAVSLGRARDEIDKAERSLRVYDAATAGGGESKQFQSAIKALRKQVDDWSAAQQEVLLAAARCPDSVYRGEDKQFLREQVLAEWKKQYPDSQVLAVVFPQKNWQRREGGVWSSDGKQLNLFDRSEFAVVVVVKSDDRLVTLHQVPIWKDHMKSDELLIGVSNGVDTKMLLANFKPLPQ